MQISIEEYEFYACLGTTDMRKRATSLSRIVRDPMKIMPFSNAVFLFCVKDCRIILLMQKEVDTWLTLLVLSPEFVN